MLQYTANDIVDKALALADLQNSDFISYKEKIQYLNDAYCNMYNKVIDYGDNIYTTIVEVEDSESELPTDFYQLREVYVMNNNTKTLLTPKPLNQSLNDLSYEIVNNTICIYGKVQGKVYYSYYTVPQSLIVEREPRELDVTVAYPMSEPYPEITSQATLIYKNLYTTRIDNTQYIKNFFNSDFSKTIPFIYSQGGAPISNLFDFFDNKCIVQVHNNVSTPMLRWTSARSSSNYGTVTIQSGDAVHQIVYYNGEWYGYSNYKLLPITISDNVISFDDSNPITVDFSINRIGTYSLDIVIFPNDLSEDNMITFNNYTYEYRINNGSVQSFSDFLGANESVERFFFLPFDKIFNQSLIFVTDKNRIFYINSDEEEPNLFKELDDDYYLIGISEFNPDTSYGLVCYSFYDQKYYMVSAFDTTELSFPNNTYFTLIAYNLAILFAQKQNKDTTQLRIELERQEGIFYDSLHRDESSFRITNVNGYSY